MPLTFAVGSFFAPLAASPDRDRGRVGRHLQVAPGNGEVGLGRLEKGNALGGPLGCDGHQTDRAAFLGKGLRQRLDQFLVIAASRPHGNPQGRRFERELPDPDGRAKQQDTGSQNQERPVPSPAGARRHGAGMIRYGHLFCLAPDIGVLSGARITRFAIRGCALPAWG
jgi:hypothetical protein